ncbi:hypothetical protein EKK58_00025 [Candidatus Dependentiae bacterium]|nr:MAG: hypothetical protein EKK58_00025 [Candidatus Dependentiae bacterium]
MQDPNKLLKAAVDNIVNSINVEKLPAHAAVVKTAKEMDLNVHFIKRACEVINVALTYEHFRKNAEARDKDFPIVDAQKVSAEVFNQPEKTTNEKKSEFFSGSIVEETVPNFRKAKHDAQFRDQFAKLSTAKDETRGMSEQGICEKAGLAKLALERELDVCRTDAAGAKHGVQSQFAYLVNHWSKEASARLSFAEFESQAFSRYGEAVIPYIDLIYKAAGCKEARGEHDPKYVAYDDSRELLVLASFLEATDALREANEKLAEITLTMAELEDQKNQAYAKLAAARQEEAQAQTDEAAPEKQAAEGPIKIEFVDPVIAAANAKVAARKEEAEKKAGVLGDSMPGKLFDAFSDHYKKESTPGGGAGGGALGNLDRKLLIQNLMATDPILKTYNPKRVADSYEQFLRLAPELSNEKEIVRSHLRQMVASQAMTAFDGAQLMDANTKLLKQKQMEGGARPIKEEK